ncbi:hypothetical protein OIU77_029142 [Salix suchowensis]|uniref:WIYLD domain-containing protein n=1 Tax=Salix suchowensis TaxID=1278906 RepID=A0ABQ9BK00_9ROSI|nr:hypothetical protein OIU77_029142 [Salix suchowensis]
MARNTGGHSKKIVEASMAVAHFGFAEEEVKETLKRPVKLHKDDWKIIEEDNFKELVAHQLRVKGKSPEFTQAAARGTRSNFMKDKDMEDRVHEGVSNSSRFDIASSVDAEVKVSLICNSSGNSYFRQRSLDAVLAVVEDECRRTYGIQNPDFSLVKLMEKVCQFFLEMENGSSSETGSKICDKSKQSEGKDAVRDDTLEPNKVLQHPTISRTTDDGGCPSKELPHLS